MNGEQAPRKTAPRPVTRIELRQRKAGKEFGRGRGNSLGKNLPNLFASDRHRGARPAGKTLVKYLTKVLPDENKASQQAAKIAGLLAGDADSPLMTRYVRCILKTAWRGYGLRNLGLTVTPMNCGRASGE